MLLFCMAGERTIVRVFARRRARLPVHYQMQFYQLNAHNMFELINITCANVIEIFLQAIDLHFASQTKSRCKIPQCQPTRPHCRNLDSIDIPLYCG